MISTELRAADPAAGTNVTATSDAAEEMLRDILSTPRAATPPHRRHRLVLGASVVGAAAAAAVAVPILMSGGGSGAASAYAVERHGDGSVDVSIDFDQFHDAAALQDALTAKGVPAVVLSGQGTRLQLGRGTTLGMSDSNGNVPASGSSPVPECAKYDSLNEGALPDRHPDDSTLPISYVASARFDDSGLRLRPDKLPTNGTFVIEILKRNDQIVLFAGDVALGAPPTCLP